MPAIDPVNFHDSVSFVNVEVDDAGISTRTLIKENIPCRLSPLPPAVTTDPKAPIDKGGFTCHMYYDADVRLGWVADVTFDGITEVTKVRRRGVIRTDTNTFLELRLEFEAI